MRRVTIVLPYLVARPESESALRPLPAALQHVVEGATVARLRPVPETTTPEAAFIGLDPNAFQVAQGPLTVAALGHRPPERSVHFHLTLASVDEQGKLRPATIEHATEDLDAVFEAAARLKTKTLTPLQGEGLDHALVWEDGSLELSTTPPQEAYGSGFLEKAPQGDGEALLRMFIDDSVNLLSSLDVNHKRKEEGRPPLNCLWPWGPGFRPDLPNLALRRGDVATVLSGSMRMEGLARIVGYRHSDRRAFGARLQTNFEQVLASAKANRLTLALVTSIEEMQRHHRADEIAHNLDLLASKVVAPLLEAEAEEAFELRIVAPGGHAGVGVLPETSSPIGLALTYLSHRKNKNDLPFDERVLDDPRASITNLWESVLPGLLGTSE